MANTLSAEKRIRTNERRRVYNRSIESRTKTLVKKFGLAVEASNEAEARTLYNEAASALDRAAKSGILHPNKAARKKSRMARRLANLG